MSALLFESGQPRYLMLANRLSADIQSGHYAVGALLPGENELCTLFGVSRHTVREAIRRLHEVGLVSRHPGIGTRVEARSVVPRFVQSIDAIEDFWQYVKESRLHIEKRGTIAPAMAPVEIPESGQDWLTFDGYRYRGDKANRICSAHVYLNPRFASIATEIGVATDPIYALIERAYDVRVVEVRQQITAVLVSPEIAGRLDVTSGSPALSTLRRYITVDGDAVEVTVSIHPADRFRYNQQIRLEVPAAGKLRSV